MDNAVALVRAYLHVNGYFTVTEFPVLEAAGAGGYRQVTDQWGVLRQATLKDPAFGFLMTLEKARRQAESATPLARAEDGGEIPRERLP